MANIYVTKEGAEPYSGAMLTEPDDDGEYGWFCQSCGDGSNAEGSGHQPIGDAIMAAKIHVDFQCERQAA